MKETNYSKMTFFLLITLIVADIADKSTNTYECVFWTIIGLITGFFVVWEWK